MKIRTGCFALAGVVAFVMATAGAGWAQKSGGILKIQHMDTPPSASIHEEATVSVAVPFMAVFNNLVMFDQHVAKNSLEVDRARSRHELGMERRRQASWSSSCARACNGTTASRSPPRTCLHLRPAAQRREQAPAQSALGLVEQRREGDGRQRLRGDLPSQGAAARRCWRCSPRATRRSIPAMFPSADMRRKPIGTGPFKFVEFKMNESIKLVKNPDYWKKGLPYLDGIEYTIIPDRSTRMLSFISGKFDMTFPTDVTVPLLKNIQARRAEGEVHHARRPASAPT